MIEKLWELLGQKLSQLFGMECASAAILMFTSLSIRLTTHVLGLNNKVPLGFIFAFPYIIQLLTTALPFMESSNPLLVVRIAETLLGRISASKLTVVIPAHFLGCIVGTIVFHTFVPFAPSAIFEPIESQNMGVVVGGSIQVCVVFLYVCCLLIIPEMLEVNRLSRLFTTLLMLPLLIIGHSVMFSPAALYALWYVNGDRRNMLDAEQLLGPIAGALAAGIFCSKMAPDDTSSYIHPERKY